MKMYCGNCGKNIPDGSEFCESCGAPVAQAAPQQYQTQPQYQDQPRYQAQPQYQPQYPVTKKKSPVLPIVIAAVAGFVDRLQSFDARFGGGTYLDFEGHYASVTLFDDADSILHFTVFEDGNADFPMGDWTYGFYDAVDIYDMLWEELCVINGYY